MTFKCPKCGGTDLEYTEEVAVRRAYKINPETGDMDLLYSEHIEIESDMLESDVIYCVDCEYEFSPVAETEWVVGWGRTPLKIYRDTRTMLIMERKYSEEEKAWRVAEYWFFDLNMPPGRDIFSAMDIARVAYRGDRYKQQYWASEFLVALDSAAIEILTGDSSYGWAMKLETLVQQCECEILRVAVNTHLQFFRDAQEAGRD